MNKEVSFAMELTKVIAQFGKVKCIECERYLEEPYDQSITFTDDSGNKAYFPLKPNYPDDETDFFNENGYLVLLNLMFQKVLHQIGEDADSYWLFDINQIDDVLNVLKGKIPFRVTAYNDLYVNLND